MGFGWGNFFGNVGCGLRKFLWTCNFFVVLSPNIKNIINETGFGTFFEALLNQEAHEYKDL